MDQKELAMLAMEGDRTSRAQLFEQNIEPIYYLLWKLTGSAAQAGELTRRTFARAFTHLNELRPEAGFDRWVTALAVSLCRQTMKKAQPWLFSTSEKEMAELRDTYLANEACLPPDCPENPDLRSLALRTISILPPEQRMCLVLHYVALLKPYQIARTMEVDEVTVLGRLNAARHALLTALPSNAPQALLTALFAQEAAALPVPELLRGSCMQTVLNTRPEPEPEEAEPAQKSEPEAAHTGLFANMPKKQRYLLFGGMGVAALLVLILLIAALRSCGKAEAPTPAPVPDSAPVEEVNQDLESAAILEEYGVEVLLTYERRDAEALIDAWQTVLPDYISSGTVEDLELTIQTSNDAVNEVHLRLQNTDLDITRLRGLGLGSEPDLSMAADALTDKYKLKCYDEAPLFDPTPRADGSMTAYSENYRYELLDENGDGRAEALSITRVGDGYDPTLGVFRPYGESLTDLLGLTKDDAEALLGSGDYPGDDISVYAMQQTGVMADGSKLVLNALMQARTDEDAAHQSLSAITMQVDGCFASLLPELALPDTALTLDQLDRKLQALPGHMGRLDGDVFTPLIMEAGQECLYYYDGPTRYLFCADATDARVKSVEVLNLSDCKLYRSNEPSFQTGGFDLEKLLGMDIYAAYQQYGIRSYATADLSNAALGLWEANGVIATVNNVADSRTLWGLALGDSRKTIEDKVASAAGYAYQETDGKVSYVLPDQRELIVTYSGENAAVLQLSDHSGDRDYSAPEKPTRPAEDLFSEYLDSLSDVKASWIGDLTHDGQKNLLICRAAGSGCLMQLYVVSDGKVNTTPIYTQTISLSASMDVYVLDQESGPCLLLYTLSESAVSNRCAWKILSVNAAGSEVVLEQDESSVNLLDIVLGDQEAYNSVKQQAEQYQQDGKFLCGTQSGAAKFASAE